MKDAKTTKDTKVVPFVVDSLVFVTVVLRRAVVVRLTQGSG